MSAIASAIAVAALRVLNRRPAPLARVIHEPRHLDIGPANAAGEVSGLGPSWVCANYARPDHDYITCRDCYSIYENDYIPRLKGAYL